MRAVAVTFPQADLATMAPAQLNQVLDTNVKGTTYAVQACLAALRRLGRTEEIGYAAAFLATREAGYITGQSIVVDGGQTLPESPDAVS